MLKGVPQTSTFDACKPRLAFSPSIEAILPFPAASSSLDLHFSSARLVFSLPKSAPIPHPSTARTSLRGGHSISAAKKSFPSRLFGFFFWISCLFPDVLPFSPVFFFFFFLIVIVLVAQRKRGTGAELIGKGKMMAEKENGHLEHPWKGCSLFSSTKIRLFCSFLLFSGNLFVFALFLLPSSFFDIKPFSSFLLLVTF